MPLFSVIVPVYNAEKTLTRCLDSLKYQGEASFEVLMVENGSTDASAAICQKYVREDNRFHLITMGTNCGPSRARNAGLDAACGEYFAFVDSDDYVAEDYLSSLRAAFEADSPDVVFFGYQRVTLEGQNKGTNIPKIAPAAGYLDLLISLTQQDVFGYTWVKAFRRDVLEGARFPTNLNLYEDEMFTCQVMACDRKVSIIPRALYYYTVGNRLSLVGRTHQDYPRKCDRVYCAWKTLLEGSDKGPEVLQEKANAAAKRCMWYCYERDVDVADFIRALADARFFAEHTKWTNFDRLVQSRSVLRIRMKRGIYRAKIRISKLLKG